jgi:hypothetical protein
LYPPITQGRGEECRLFLPSFLKKGYKMSYQKFAEKLFVLGWDTTPLRGKIPIIKGWQTRPEAALKFDNFPGANIGIILGGTHNIFAVDIDVLDEAAAGIIRDTAEQFFGTAPERIGKKPKTLLVYRCTQPIHKIKSSIFDVAGHDCCVEILAEGQQFCASGIHPDTGKKYDWPGDSLLDYTPHELTPVEPDTISNFVEACNTALGNCGKIKVKTHNSDNVVRIDGKQNFEFQANDPTTSPAKLQAAMCFLRNDNLHYDDWVRLAHAFKAAVGPSGIDLFHDFSAKSSKYDDVETDRLWDSIENVTKIGAGSLYKMAAEQGFDIANWDTERNFGPENMPDVQAVNSSKTPDLSPDGDGSFTAASVKGPIAARQWALDGWFPARTVAMLFGAGGVGKTLLMQQFANCVAQGAPFLGIDTMKMPVLSVMCEDDADEVKRRQLNINEWLGVDEFGEGPEDLHLWPRVGSDNVLVTWPGGGQDEPGEFFGQLCAKVAAVKGDAPSVLVILDTAADMFGGNENERRTVNTFLKTYLGSIVINYNATVILLAHPSLSGLKGSGLSGSTAWENSVRSRSYLSRQEDSDEIRVLSRKKSNYSDISGNSDIKLIWEKGVLIIPSSPDALDRINATALKHDIMAEVDIAWGEKNAYRKQNARGYKTALPRVLKQHKAGAVIKAFNDLVAEGNIIHVDRFGFKTEKVV